MSMTGWLPAFVRRLSPRPFVKADTPVQDKILPMPPHDHPLHVQAAEAADKAYRQIAEMRTTAGRLQDREAADKLFRLIRLADAIASETCRRPGSLPVAQRFYTFDLPTAGKLCRLYDRIIHSDYYNKEMDFQVKRIERLWDALKRRCVRHLNRMVMADLMRVDLELSAYERMLRAEEAMWMPGHPHGS